MLTLRKHSDEGMSQKYMEGQGDAYENYMRIESWNSSKISAASSRDFYYKKILIAAATFLVVGTFATGSFIGGGGGARSSSPPPWLRMNWRSSTPRLEANPSSPRILVTRAVFWCCRIRIFSSTESRVRRR